MAVASAWFSARPQIHSDTSKYHQRGGANLWLDQGFGPPCVDHCPLNPETLSNVSFSPGDSIESSSNPI